MAIKPKEWLFDNGHMTREEADKRGRMSLANKSLVMEAVANGAQIEGYSVVKDNDSNTGTAVPKVERVAIDPNRMVDVPDITRDERVLMAYVMIDGKKVERGMRSVDYNCGSSFTYCGCKSPQIWVDSETLAMVRFAPRTK